MTSEVTVSQGSDRRSASSSAAVRGADYWGRLLVVAAVAIWLAGLKLGFVWSLSLLSVLGFAATIVGLERPALGLLGISLICTLDPIMRHFLLVGGLLRWNTFNYWLLIVMVAHRGLILRIRDKQTVLLWAFLVLLTVELAFTERLSRGAQHILGIGILFGLLVYFARAALNDRAWYWQGILGGTVGALGGLVYNLQRGQLAYVNYNAWALFPETAIFAVCLAFPFAARKREEVALVSLAGLNLVWVFLSSSRGGMMIGGVGMLFLLASVKGVSAKAGYLAGAVVLAMAMSTTFGDLQDNSVARFQKLMSGDETAGARTSGRSDLALGGWHIFMESPLGVGTGGSELAWSRLAYVEGISDFESGEEFSLHSGWVKVLAENGLPGIVLFAALVFSFAVVGIQNGGRYMAALGVMVSATLAVAFLSTEFQGKGFWFLSAGALTLLHRQEIAIAVASGRNRSLWWADRGAAQVRLLERLELVKSPARARKIATVRRGLPQPRPRV